MADLGRPDRRDYVQRRDLNYCLNYRSRPMSDAPGKSMRTPLARVRSLGSSHSGTTEFWRQRVTAVALILLIIPVLVVVMSLLGRNQAFAAQPLGSPLIAIIMLLFIVASVCHMRIGLQLVLE